MHQVFERKKLSEKVTNLFSNFGAKIWKELTATTATTATTAAAAADTAAKKVIKIVVKHFSFFAEILVCFG